MDQLDRIEGKVDTIDERMRLIELRLAKDDGKAEAEEHAGGRVRAVLHAVIGPIISPLISAAIGAGATLHFFGRP